MFEDIVPKKKYTKKQRIEWVRVLDYTKVKKAVKSLSNSNMSMQNKLTSIANIVSDNRGKLDKKEDFDALMELVLDIVNEDTD